MKKRPGKAGKRKNVPKGGLTRRGLRRILIYGGAALGLVLAAALVLFLTRPKLLWYVDGEYAAAWNRILSGNAPPISRYEIVSRSGDDFPRGRYGFIVSANGPSGERMEGAPVALYPNLSRSREYGGWMALALDPWMIFRKHHDPEPGRSVLNPANERGTLLLAGLDKNAQAAWLCQVMQEKPGVFPQGGELWDENGQNLVIDYPFQNGALTYSWVQVWPLLYRDNVAYLYAPLSQARAQPTYRAGLLDATRFPEPQDWDRYGMQADVLWAKIYGNEKQLSKMESTVRWLKDAATQTAIANMMEWIPAHPSGVPYNTISWETQMAWLRSSFIWQGVYNAQD